MRIFYFISLLFSLEAFAQLDTGTGADGACDENFDFSAGGTFNCDTLTIAGPLVFFPFNVAATALIIKVKNAVSISSALDLTGAASANLNTGAPSNGGQGGPGAGNGGGSAAGTPQDAGATANDGKTATTDGIGACGGGGGGGFALAAASGVNCPTNGNPGIAGSAYSSSTLFGGTFRGGFGGGAGGEGPVDGQFGGGGGGGGALHIIAGGSVTISALIDASGGAGGNTASDGGGGGGGSGGVIWIQSNNQINLTGANLLRVNAGAAGLGTVTNANGGLASRGFIRLEDVDGAIANAPAISDVLSTTASSPNLSLKSDISCGMVKPKNESHSYQMILGFMMALILMGLIKILFQFLKQTSKKIANLY